MPKSTRTRRTGKSPKPYPEFPLTAHPSGRWCKKFQGKQHYFGKLNDWRAALERYEREWPYIITGRTPPSLGDENGYTLRDLCNEFLTDRKHKLESGELSLHTFSEYKRTCERLIEFFKRERLVSDLRPEDFREYRKHLAKGCGAVTLASKINRCRVVFKFAYDNRRIDRPVEYGASFDRPSAKSLRKARNESGPRMFEAAELQRIIEASDPMMKAMVLLGLNAGFGNTDVANLPRSAVDLKRGWVDFPREKTGVMRRCPLWPETVESLRQVESVRPDPIDEADDDLCFITSRGTRYVRIQESKTTEGRHVTINSLSRRFESPLKRLEINGRRGLGFYTLRHVFETIAGESRDQVAVNAIMGHVDNSMAAVYRERISDKRLVAVVETVRKWLWPEST